MWRKIGLWCVSLISIGIANTVILNIHKVEVEKISDTPLYILLWFVIASGNYYFFYAQNELHGIFKKRK